MGLQKKRFSKLQEAISDLDRKYQDCLDKNLDIPKNLRQDRIERLLERAESFPSTEEQLLPTSFGNTIRAFEDYPRVIYGIESIDGWSRLIAIIPKEYVELIDNAKTQVDFWINISILSFLLLMEYIGLAIYTKSLVVFWLPMLLLAIVAWLSPRFAISFAVQWGNYVKAAFDVFTPKLREQLGIRQPSNREDERKEWKAFSQTIIYRDRDQLPELKQSNQRKKVVKK